MRFYPSTIYAKPGTLKLTLVNRSQGTPHNLVWRAGGPTGHLDYVAGGQDQTVTVTIASTGTFEFVCSFHESMGMTGTLVVGP